jgi:hypothetical protein
VFFSRKIGGTYGPPDTDARAARADAEPRDNDALLDIYAFPEALCVEVSSAQRPGVILVREAIYTEERGVGVFGNRFEEAKPARWSLESG